MVTSIAHLHQLAATPYRTPVFVPVNECFSIAPGHSMYREEIKRLEDIRDRLHDFTSRDSTRPANHRNQEEFRGLVIILAAALNCPLRDLEDLHDIPANTIGNQSGAMDYKKRRALADSLITESFEYAKILRGEDRRIETKISKYYTTPHGEDAFLEHRGSPGKGQAPKL